MISSTYNDVVNGAMTKMGSLSKNLVATMSVCVMTVVSFVLPCALTGVVWIADRFFWEKLNVV